MTRGSKKNSTKIRNSKANIPQVHSLNILLGGHTKIATITLPVGSETDLTLVYEPSWIADGFAISPHLPLDGSFAHQSVRNYLQNLLPEGKGLEEITTNTTISKNNTFGLIKIIGEETSGAFSFKAEGTTKSKTTYREISPEELKNKLDRFKRTGESITYWDGRTRLSVAGVQDKLNVLELNGKLGFGEGKLCSNKIFKFETGKVPFIAVNELFTMLLAKEMGLDIPAVEIRTYGEVRTFVIDRFDRRVSPEKDHVLRRHVIDACQATNLPPSYKYERQHGDDGDGIYIRDGVSFTKLFNVKTVNPQAYQSQLIKWMTFNIINRNFDAHGKNISFFLGKQGVVLTPFYDLVNIEAIIREIQNKQRDTTDSLDQSAAPQMPRNYAMSIGEFEPGTSGNFNPPITAYMLADFAHEFDISLPRLQLLMSQMLSGIENAQIKAKENAIKQGLSDNELNHIDLCITIIDEATAQLKEEIEQLPDMAVFI
jgi:serine/threonine-protein kinase HipA